MSMEKIVVTGAKVHNLKNISVEIPRNKLVVITGLSGSGKSSLAFDTIFAEGQRRYIESLSTYARQFLEIMGKPDVESIEGLSPAISIDQKSSTRNPRSTVGTVTEIYDYLRLLFAKIGHPHCPVCDKVISRQSPSDILEQVLRSKDGSKLMILSPLIRDRKGEHKAVFEKIQKDGFVRMRVNGKVMTIMEEVALDPKKKHSIDVVIDRMVIHKELEAEDRTRLSESIEIALRLSGGLALVLNADTGEENLFSEFFACADCGVNLPEITPRSFSFNSPHGACEACHGLGVKFEVDPDLVMPNPRLTLAEGAIMPWSKTSNRLSWYNKLLEAVSKKHKFSIDVPVGELPEDVIKKVLYGTGREFYQVEGETTKRLRVAYEGVIPNLERRYRDTDSDHVRRDIETYMRELTCPECEGKRLRKEVLSVLVGDKSIIDVTQFSIAEGLEFFENLKLSEHEQFIARLILKEILNRLTFLMKVGLSYLTLDRSAGTLAGGEAQRIRLATQLGSQLMGVLYVLDEPSIGLHQRDNGRLIETMKHLRDLGNTVLVVEHDEETITEADHIIDIGPGAGTYGGQVIAEGTAKQIQGSKDSITGQYLSGALQITSPEKRRKGNGKKLILKGATEHNLKNVDAAIPLGCFVGVTGVSGSGKSTLINDILVKVLSRKYHHAKKVPGRHETIMGTQHLDKIIAIDQKPIGRTPRSNPATYTGVFTEIRDLFARTPEAKLRGYKPGRFSFNVKGGRCEPCRGDGIVKIEMHFLPDIYVPCESCKGLRYNPQALEILYKGRNISDVLDMTVDEAHDFFSAVPKIERALSILQEVGLGYLKLGQSATTLSGGEAQRIKLATELARKSTGRTLYVLDEPTTGLHFADVDRLLHVLNRLVESGNTVLTIEHNLDVIKSCDYLIDMGPEGGDGGGMVVACGTPEEVSKIKKSHTGSYLKKLLKV